ncbi:hypothetical protein V1514DRAFT_337832 [Lipomyces japonicus]|uniref:uncharacterized protein n=1 Tax=Lipomyces japonicus TaxID=56871 RepID=UPI0034CF7F27
MRAEVLIALLLAWVGTAVALESSWISSVLTADSTVPSSPGSSGLVTDTSAASASVILLNSAGLSDVLTETGKSVSGPLVTAAASSSSSVSGLPAAAATTTTTATATATATTEASEIATVVPTASVTATFSLASFISITISDYSAATAGSIIPSTSSLVDAPSLAASTSADRPTDVPSASRSTNTKTIIAVVVSVVVGILVILALIFVFVYLHRKQQRKTLSHVPSHDTEVSGKSLQQPSLPVTDVAAATAVPLDVIAEEEEKDALGNPKRTNKSLPPPPLQPALHGREPGPGVIHEKWQRPRERQQTSSSTSDQDAFTHRTNSANDANRHVFMLDDSR